MFFSWKIYHINRIITVMILKGLFCLMYACIAAMPALKKVVPMTFL